MVWSLWLVQVGWFWTRSRKELKLAIKRKKKKKNNLTKEKQLTMIIDWEKKRTLVVTAAKAVSDSYYFHCCPHTWITDVYTNHPSFPYMRASYYAIRETGIGKFWGSQGPRYIAIEHDRTRSPDTPFLRSNSYGSQLPWCTPCLSQKHPPCLFDPYISRWKY